MTRPVKTSPTFPNLHFHTCSTPASVASCRLERNVGFHLVRPGRVPRDLLDRHALYPRRPRRVALTRWLGTRCTRAALGAWRSPMARHVLPRDLLARHALYPCRPRRAALTRWLGTYSRTTGWLGTRCTRAALGARRSPDGSARTPAPPSARGARQMARHALPRDLLARHALYPRRPRRVALTRWLGTHSRATCWLNARKCPSGDTGKAGEELCFARVIHVSAS